MSGFDFVDVEGAYKKASDLVAKRKEILEATTLDHQALNDKYATITGDAYKTILEMRSAAPWHPGFAYKSSYQCGLKDVITEAVHNPDKLAKVFQLALELKAECAPVAGKWHSVKRDGYLPAPHVFEARYVETTDKCDVDLFFKRWHSGYDKQALSSAIANRDALYIQLCQQSIAFIAGAATMAAYAVVSNVDMSLISSLIAFRDEQERRLNTLNGESKYECMKMLLGLNDIISKHTQETKKKDITNVAE